MAPSDSRGCCPAHTYVQLRKRSRRSGRWQTLLDHCPVCAAEDDGDSSSSSDGGEDGRSENGGGDRADNLHGGSWTGGVDVSTRSAPEALCAAADFYRPVHAGERDGESACRSPAASTAGSRLSKSVSFTDDPASVDFLLGLDESDQNELYEGSCQFSYCAEGSDSGSSQRLLGLPAGMDEGRPLLPAMEDADYIAPLPQETRTPGPIENQNAPASPKPRPSDDDAGSSDEEDGGGSDAGSLSEEDIFGDCPRSIEITVSNGRRCSSVSVDKSDRSARSLPESMTGTLTREEVIRRLSTSQNWDGEAENKKRERRRKIGEYRRRQLAAHGSSGNITGSYTAGIKKRHTAPVAGGGPSRREDDSADAMKRRHTAGSSLEINATAGGSRRRPVGEDASPHSVANLADSNHTLPPPPIPFERGDGPRPSSSRRTRSSSAAGSELRRGAESRGRGAPGEGLSASLKGMVDAASASSLGLVATKRESKGGLRRSASSGSSLPSSMQYQQVSEDGGSRPARRSASSGSSIQEIVRENEMLLAFASTKGERRRRRSTTTSPRPPQGRPSKELEGSTRSSREGLGGSVHSVHSAAAALAPPPRRSGNTSSSRGRGEMSSSVHSHSGRSPAPTLLSSARSAPGRETNSSVHSRSSRRSPAPLRSSLRSSARSATSTRSRGDRSLSKSARSCRSSTSELDDTIHRELDDDDGFLPMDLDDLCRDLSRDDGVGINGGGAPGCGGGSSSSSQSRTNLTYELTPTKLCVRPAVVEVVAPGPSSRRYTSASAARNKCGLAQSLCGTESTVSWSLNVSGVSYSDRSL